MIVDLAKKYAPHLLHWPTWIIDNEAFETFLAENKLVKHFSTDLDNILSLRHEIYSQTLIVPRQISEELKTALILNRTYELRMPSPIRLKRIAHFAELEESLKEFWLEMYFGGQEKSRELKLYESLPETIYESHVSRNGSPSPISKLNYFPVRFESFIYENNYYVREIAPLTDYQTVKPLPELPMVSGKQAPVNGIPICSGLARGHWTWYHRQPVKGKIAIAGRLTDENLRHLLSSHPKGVILTKVPNLAQISIIKRRGIPTVYVAPEKLHLNLSFPVTVNGTLGTVSV